MVIRYVEDADILSQKHMLCGPLSTLSVQMRKALLIAWNEINAQCQDGQSIAGLVVPGLCQAWLAELAVQKSTN